MGVFYDRVDENARIIIKYKLTRLLFPFIMAGLVTISFLSSIFIGGFLAFFFLAPALFLFLFFGALYLTDAWKVECEIRDAVKAGKAKFSGSVLSLSNPRIVEIKKIKEKE